MTRVRLDVDKVVVTCRQSEASAEALACEEREHEFQKEAQLACACLRNVECQAAESEQRLTEKLKVRDMEILCLQRRLEGVVAADGVVLGMAVA